MRIYFKLFTVLCIVTLLISCGKKGEKTIGVTLLTKQHQFYQTLLKGLKEEAGKYNYDLLVVSGEFDAAKQANQIEDFIVKKVDAMIVCPCDASSIGVSIVEANKANIPVFTADIANISKSGKVVSHIASDNIQGGMEAGKLLAKALNGKGKIAIINHPTVTSVLDRVKGFKQVIKKYPGIEIVADISAEGQRSKAMAAMEDLLQRHSDLDGVFGINDDSALGALAAVESARKSHKIVIVGYDATDEAKIAIKAKKIYGDVIQYPYEIGVLTIQAINKHLNGEKVPDVIPVKVGSWTGEK